jgi:hypothetical protein
MVVLSIYSIVPEMIGLNKTICQQILSTLRCSSLMRSVVSFELEDKCVLSSKPNDDELCFSQSIQLTHIQITLCQFDQFGSQLQSFSVTLIHLGLFNWRMSEITLVSNIL